MNRERPPRHKCAIDDCGAMPEDGHTMCRRHLAEYARACRTGEIAEIRRQRGR